MTVKFKTCDLLRKTAKKYQTNKRVIQALDEFRKAKEANPTQKFGSKDYRFPAGHLTEYWHAGLTFDVSLIYRLERSGENYVFLLYGLFSHDDSGTGSPSDMGRQKALSSKLSNQVFESKKT